MGHSERRITDFSGLLAEDSSEQALFSSQFSLTLRCDLTHQNITGANLRADADDTPLVQILKRILTHIGNITGDLFRTQFGVTGFGFIFLYMDGCVNIIPNKFFTYENSILVVITLPGHESHENVLAKGNLTVVGGRTVGNNIPFFNLVTLSDNGTLVDAGTLVGTLILKEFIIILGA